jgi:hypothetical protein
MAVPGAPEHLIDATAGVGVGSGDGLGVGLDRGVGVGSDCGVGLGSVCWVGVAVALGAGDTRAVGTSAEPQAIVMTPAKTRAATRCQAMLQT